jgi:hypothetical protein
MPKKEPSEFDINKVTAEFVQHNIENFVRLGTDVFKTATRQVQLRLDRTYKAYLKRVAEKCSRTKSFFIRGEPVYLYQFYVPLSVRHGNTIIKNINFFQVPRCSMIVASGGSGKSMLMKHLVLSALLQKGKVPVFIQLQHLNRGDLNLLGLIQKTLSDNKFHLDGEYITQAIREGHFALFLDGLDEVVERKRQVVGHAIREFARTNDQNAVIVSSRPDPELEGWQDFTILKVLPLTLELACELVAKLPYDDQLKDKFLEDLKTSLFSKHQSFLSNPLLLSIMLLTYGQSANIPDKLNVFYNQAYEALFERHDALKGGYSRARKTKLDIQDFARVFSAFCLQSYDKGQLEFSRVEILSLFEASKAVVGVETNKEDFLKDCLQAVCLLVEDGLKIVFTHRSFQEYFTARFIAESSPKVQERLISKYSPRVRRDSVLPLLYEIRPDVVEQYYLLPKLDALFEFIGYQGGAITKEQFLKYAQVTHSEVQLGRKNEEHFTASVNAKDIQGFASLSSFALRHCGRQVGWNGFKKVCEDSKWMLEKYGSEDGAYKVYALAGMTADTDFIKDLFEKGSFFSVETLQVMAKIRVALKEKTAKKESSLEEILKSKN